MRGRLREGAALRDASQVLDPTAGVLYALVSASPASGSGPYSLLAIDLRTGRVRRGESYPVSGQEIVTSGPGLVIAALAADPKARKVAAVISDSDYAGVVAISPPRACWNWRSA